MPLGRSTSYLPAYDEILIGIAPDYGVRPFDQNRLFFGVGKALRAVNVEVGFESVHRRTQRVNIWV
jgi:hypothetical protein